jgi:hypothetical protein
MVLAFFNSKGLIYTNHMPMGTMHGERHLSHGCPVQVHEGFQAEKAGCLVAPLGQCPSVHRHHGDRLDGGQSDPGDP